MTVRISTSSNGMDTNGQEDVFVRDLLTNQTSRASISSSGAQANGTSAFASASGDGRLVSFRSHA
ncbi:MAG: hypothetical protein U1E76_21955 [Planctomycetota bacterium]